MACIVDSYDESHYKADVTLYAGAQIQRGQSFTGSGNPLYSVKFYLSKTGSPTGLAYGVLWTHTGTFGTSSKGTDPQLALSDPFDVSTLGGSKILVELTFSTSYTLVNGAKYVTSLYYVNGNISNCVNVGIDNSGATHPGNACYVTADGQWHVESAGVDTIFYVYGISLTGSNMLLVS
jgi:hypothetical protein